MHDTLEFAIEDKRGKLFLDGKGFAEKRLLDILRENLEPRRGQVVFVEAEYDIQDIAKLEKTIKVGSEHLGILAKEGDLILAVTSWQVSSHEDPTKYYLNTDSELIYRPVDGPAIKPKIEKKNIDLVISRCPFNVTARYKVMPMEIAKEDSTVKDFYSFIFSGQEYSLSGRHAHKFRPGQQA